MEKIIRTAYFSDDPTKKSSHYHDCHQVIFITGGRAKICVNNANYVATAGNIVIFSRYEDHSVEVLSPGYERYVLHIGALNTSGENKLYSILANRPSGFDNILDVSDDIDGFRRLFDGIVKESSSSDRMSGEMVQLLTDQLLVMMYRRIPEQSVSMERQMFDTVFDIQRRFETDFAKEYTLSGLARDYSVSPSSLSHRFKSITGRSVMDYLISCRIASAKNFLIKSTMDIGEIVEKCGFSDNSNFSRIFKKLNGISPSEFRNQYR